MMKRFVTKNNNKVAFTIAEIVVTMIILGSIATILMPVILNDTRDKINEVALNKTYSMFQQNARSVGLLISQGKIVEQANESETFFDALAMINKSKRGKNGTNSQMEASLADYSPEFILGDKCKINNFLATDSNTLILNNGVFIMEQNVGCNWLDDNGENQSLPGETAGHKIIVDTNGVRSPNKVGEDIFFFNVIKDSDDGSYFVKPSPGECNGQDAHWIERIGCAKSTLGMK